MQEKSINNTSQNQEQPAEQHQPEIISTAHKLTIASALKSLKMEIEATIRLYEKPHSEVTKQSLETLQQRYNQVLENIWNP